MKKRLFTLGTLVLLSLTNAQTSQQDLVYVGDNAKFFVSNNALVYSGGHWTVNSATEKTVENKGNIIIVGDYKKGSSVSKAAEDGKEFVNVYTGEKDYGQVKLLSTSGSSTGRMTMQKPAASSAYFGASYAISFPYQDNVEYLMHSFNKQESDFKGTCAVNTVCADRYKMTLTKWSNTQLQHDAVPKSTPFKPGEYYNLNLREVDMQGAMTQTIGYKGKPHGGTYTQTAKGVIYGLNEQQFSDLGYNDWKVRTNPYNEKYESYMGKVSSTSKVLNKNVYRFGNPYTSNLDLSDFGTGNSTNGNGSSNNAWLKIKKDNQTKTLKEAYAAQYIRDFYISKRMSNYGVQWGQNSGSSNNNNTANYYTAKFDGTQWTGSAEALIIRPLETFNLNFPTLNAKTLGSRILEVEVSFNDNHKTFEHTPKAKTSTSTSLTSRSAMSARSVDAVSSDFYQLEVFLLKDNAVISSPAYMVGSTSYKESGANAYSANKVFAYGVKDDAVAYNSQKEFNEFNVNTYVGKPLGIGFNDLQNGSTYQLRFNLYEGSIFNKVEALSNGVFYLKDKSTNKVVQLNGKDAITFVADKDVASRYEVYWKQVPQSATPASIPTKVEEVVDAKSSTATMAYKEGNVNKIRFENIVNTARVEVFNVSGTLISSKDAIPTNTDYTLVLGSEGMYIVRVVYQNGEVRILKIVNN